MRADGLDLTRINKLGWKEDGLDHARINLRLLFAMRDRDRASSFFPIEMLVTKWWARDTSYFFLIFFYLRLLWVFIAAWGLSLVLASFLWGLRSGCGAWAPHCGGFSCCRAQALGHKGFKRGGTKVWLFQGMWNLPRPGIKLSVAWARQILSHWTTREVPKWCFLKS